jgi:hypothetical protein
MIESFFVEPPTITIAGLGRACGTKAVKLRSSCSTCSSSLRLTTIIATYHFDLLLPVLSPISDAPTSLTAHFTSYGLSSRRDLPPRTTYAPPLTPILAPTLPEHSSFLLTILQTPLTLGIRSRRKSF